VTKIDVYGEQTGVPMNEEMSADYAQQVGERLRNIRRQQNLSLQSAEALSDREFKASVLGAYERGERVISVARLQRLARLYGVPVDQLLPRDVGPLLSVPRRDRAMAEPPADDTDTRKVSIDLAHLRDLDAPEKELITRYVGLIQLQRGDFNGRLLTIRDEDVRALARLFEMDADTMRSRMEELGICI
jgi:transcriptional regulator with XRE-family HTH domain